MKIALDFRALDGASRYRGIGIYIQHLSEHLLPELLIDNEVVIYVYDESNLSGIRKNILNKCSIITVKRPFTARLQSPLPRIIASVYTSERHHINTLTNIKSVDLFFQPYHFFGVPKGITSIVVGYDLIPYIFEKEYFETHSLSASPLSWIHVMRDKLRKRNYQKSFVAFKKADGIVAISQQTKKDLMQFVDIDEGKITVTLLGPPDIATKAAPLDFLSAIPRPYVAFIGGIDGRRDLAHLLDGVASAHQLGVHLVLAGRDFEDIRDPSIAQRVEKGVNAGSVSVIGFIDEAQKRTVIEQSLAVVYPTLYEGFGLPLLEAFAYGSPIITYKNSSVPEVGGEAALYAQDINELIAHIQTLKDDQLYRKNIVAAGKKQVKKFSWERTAQETLQYIKNVKTH